MKLLPLLVFLYCIHPEATAQKDSAEQAFLKNKCNRFYMLLLSKTSKSVPASAAYYSNFEVADFRADTSRIGFWANENGRDKIELLFRNTTSKTLAKYLNETYTHPSGTGTHSLFIVLKKLWLFDTITVNISKDLKKQTGIGKGRIVFRAEAFLHTDDGFLPYTYLDTVVASPRLVINMNELPGLLSVLVDKIMAVDDASIVKRSRIFSYNLLDSLNKKRFLYPMDTASILKRGVYTNVDEFRNNQPSILDFEIQQDNNDNIELFLKDEAGKPYFTRKVWGYCDGYNCYKMMDGDLFPILSIQHAFYVWGAKGYRIGYTGVPVAVPAGPGFVSGGFEPVAGKAIRRMRIYSLDVYTGQVY
jgi:hypothetical protein